MHYLCFSIPPVAQTGHSWATFDNPVAPLPGQWSSPSFCRSLQYTPVPHGRHPGVFSPLQACVNTTGFPVLLKLNKYPFSSSQIYFLPRGVNHSSWLCRLVPWLFLLYNLIACCPQRHWMRRADESIVHASAYLLLSTHHQSKSSPFLKAQRNPTPEEESPS